MAPTKANRFFIRPCFPFLLHKRCSLIRKPSKFHARKSVFSRFRARATVKRKSSGMAPLFSLKEILLLKLTGFSKHTIRLDNRVSSTQVSSLYFSTDEARAEGSIMEDTATSGPEMTRLGSDYSDALNSLEGASGTDQELDSDDGTIQGRVDRILQTLADGPESTSLPLEAFMEVVDCLRETDQEIVNFLLEHKDGILENNQMLLLINEYLKNSSQAINFYSALESCLRRARSTEKIIKGVLIDLEEQLRNGSAVGYEKLLKDLRSFKEAGDPFTDQFLAEFNSVYEQQKTLFKNLTSQKKKLDRSLRSFKKCKRVVKVIFGAALVSFLVFSLVAVFLCAPPVVVAVGVALDLPVSIVGQWCRSVWDFFVKDKQQRSGLVDPMIHQSGIFFRDFEKIGSLICKLEHGISILSSNATLPLEDKAALEGMLDEMSTVLSSFSGSISELSKHSLHCSHFIHAARDEIVKKILIPRS